MNLTKINMLQSIIQEQLEILKEILDAEKNKNSILIEGKLTDFSSINDNLSKIMVRSEEAELKRENILKELIIDNPSIFEEKPLTFQILLEAIKDFPEYQEMRETYLSMKETVSDIKYYATINKDLIETALNVLNLTLEEEKKDIDYTGQSNVNQNSSKLVNKVI